MAATALSFWAVGHYDAVLHRHLETGTPEKQARLAGVSAIAVSQTLGLGLITGAIVRWWMLPGQSLGMATRLTVAVALSFLAGWAVVTALVLVALPGAPFKTLAGLALALAVVAVGVSLAAPRIWRRFGPELTRLRWPNLFTLARLLALCAVDTLAAGLAFHILLPPEIALPMATLLPAFLLALGAGLVSGSPAGLGGVRGDAVGAAADGA